ncbi:hypothetical protein [Aromatoleum aromaticum]|uniref:hypothetical protein n=1 Tax=Aromatoleum aromaticum TaxID=551760 RepID=UPI001459C153|nr:hypothetical protein [Aromatoleum aromaticum]NMG56228.1 hypothetical protein [Aromatoleum aromaticum]
MQFPDFYRAVPRLKVRDALAAFLGAVEDGVIEYGYEDAVKLAGHSCPTVGSAYLLTCHALTALYPDELPQRGGVRVEFRNRFEDGVTGVIASVVTLLSGAAQDGGFKGLAGRHVRRGLQQFAVDLPLALRFTRLDTGAAVDAEADLSTIPADPAMPSLMARCLTGAADADEQRQFGALWQDRVRRILLDHGDDPEVFRIHHPSA